MALSSKSLMNYGLEITAMNQNLDFKIASLGAQLTAVIPLGFYSVKGLCDTIALALLNADSSNNYTCSVSYNYLGGTQNRITIQTTGTYLSLLFGTGTHVLTSIASLIGFNQVDYSGALFYVGSQSAGTVFIPLLNAYNYLGPETTLKVFGAVNVSASGLKETVTFNFQQFIQLEFMYEPEDRLTEWQLFWRWAIQQRNFDFIPEITNPSVLFQVSLEKTDYDGKGLGYQMKEMLPNFPNLYRTGSIQFRVVT